ncbi:MAG TPA: diguanylate cyclase [Terriglobales bacterium]|nr:diguanylate cyclase [Terriglobales bacterium]
MADISKRIEKAEKYLQKGKIDSALEEYLSILDEDPGNDAIRQTTADLFLQSNRSAEAAALLSELFDRQLASGDNIRAGVTYKKLSKFAIPKLGQTLRYAQVAERVGNRREALDAYDAAVKGFLQEHRENEALSALRRMTAIDGSESSLLRLAELAGKLKDRQTAAEAYLKIGLKEEDEGHIGFKWFERAYKEDPSSANIAYRYGKGLLDKGEIDRALKVLEPAGTAKVSLPDHREAYGIALVAAHRAADAYPLLWPLYEKTPAKMQNVGALIGELLSSQNYKQALELAKKADAQQNRLGNRREYGAMLREVIRDHPPDSEFLEFVATLFNDANREHDYSDSLIQLFELRYASGDFQRAAEALDRAAEVDPYIEGLERRLDMLRGKVDANRLRTIANRLRNAETETGSDEEEEEQETEPTAEELEGESTVLEDLMLQAEIFLQYSMRSKAMERMERIQKLFPHEEEQNDKLRQLYVSAGISPQYKDRRAPAQPPAAAPVKPAPPAVPAPVASASPASPKAAAAEGSDSIGDFTRITEITQNIYRQSNVKGVLFASANDVGRHWNASRCIASLCSPGKPPSAALEYCAPGVKQSDVMSIVRLIGALQALVVQRGPLAIEDVRKIPELGSIKEHLDALELKSALAAPLMDGDEHVGIIILEQIDKKRQWRPPDIVILKTIADQMVLAVNNAKLRSLMKTLAVTDEKSGLLKRASYIDVVTAEVKRSLQQNQSMTVMLLKFGKAGALIREVGESAVEGMMQNVGQSVCANIRQTDTAIRYDKISIALVLGDTKDANAFFVVEKIRKVIADTKIPGTERPVTMAAGIAGGVIHKEYDPVDIVTEVINRAEHALDKATAESPNGAHTEPPSIETVAVA